MRKFCQLKACYFSANRPDHAKGLKNTDPQRQRERKKPAPTPVCRQLPRLKREEKRAAAARPRRRRVLEPRGLIKGRGMPMT